MYKQIEIATASQTSIPLIHHLIGKKLLKSITIPTTYEGAVPFFKQQLFNQYLKYTDDQKVISPDKETDLIISFGYPGKITLIPHVKMINVHFGKLPENRGADPVFQTLKSGNPMAYISIHEMTQKLDEGDVLLEQSVEVLPGEYYGMLSSRLANMSVSLIDQVITADIKPTKQDISKAKYFDPVKEEETIIRWHSMNAVEIEHLVNACNPKYGGAKTTIMGSQLNLSEVSVAQVNLNPGQAHPQPGTIVYTNPNEGIFVACKDNSFLRLNILSTSDGLISGFKLASLGTQPGLILGN